MTDVSNIRFPSDKLTISEIRKKTSGLMDHKTVDKLSADYDRHSQPYYRTFDSLQNLAQLLRNERDYADLCLKKATDYRYQSTSMPSYGSMICDDRIRKMAEYLVRDYIKCGLASGEHTAQELVKSIEKQVKKILGNDTSPP